ncbi:MAG: 16S rRNA (guanine(527)-N(7))-methyltransferase RsmG [Betaproteobacteria bacterium]|nr:MAG: 16S rRNA (guanine(527)-N(7))-methyltransferase RsmG [Betaproteobacteria bacterium]
MIQVHDSLEVGLSALNIGSDAAARKKLRQYLALIAKWNKVHNLTAIRDPDRMLPEHLLDSLSILPHVHPSRILDVGSGAGLPGIPLAIVQPSWDVTLLDSSHKRCVFLRQATIELGLANVDVVCQRIEEHRPARPFDTVVSRAFAETQHFARLAISQIADGGLLVAMKGLHPHEEIAQLPPQVALRDVVRIEVPGLGAQRHLVIMTKA